ncbi:unnamed protein product [Staurois parvus]|uniref:Uncharacterized protein n=1 Tax=Staurois parvus TaxID=386267 RepID=A0ABN9DGR2_9NEOB|nr:unnamed protein product [Staurois parvus]
MRRYIAPCGFTFFAILGIKRGIWKKWFETQRVECTFNDVKDIQGTSSDITTYLGTPLEEMNRMPVCYNALPPLKPSANHTITVRVDRLQDNVVPVPHPSSFTETWDSIHVKMPCSKNNIYPVDDHV